MFGAAHVARVGRPLYAVAMPAPSKTIVLREQRPHGPLGAVPVWRVATWWPASNEYVLTPELYDTAGDARRAARAMCDVDREQVRE